MPGAHEQLGVLGVHRGRLAADRGLQAELAGPRDQLLRGTSVTAGSRSSKTSATQLGVAVGAEQQLGEVVRADRDAGDAERRRSASRWKRTDGTSAITHSSKPRPVEQAGLRSISSRQARELARRCGRTAASRAGSSWPASQTRVDAPRARARSRSGSCDVAQGAAVADHRVGLLGLEALAALEAAELVGAEVDRPVGDRPRREGGGERRQRRRPSARRTRSPAPSSSSSARVRPRRAPRSPSARRAAGRRRRRRAPRRARPATARRG